MKNVKRYGTIMGNVDCYVLCALMRTAWTRICNFLLTDILLKSFI